MTLEEMIAQRDALLAAHDGAAEGFQTTHRVSSRTDIMMSTCGRTWTRPVCHNFGHAIDARSKAASSREAAVAYVQGTPLRVMR